MGFERQQSKVIRDNGQTVWVDVSTPTFKDVVMTIDKVDYEKLQSDQMGKIFSHKKPGGGHVTYAIARRKNGKMCKIHSAIMPAIFPLRVDHINGNGLDNRRANLRITTASDNGKNRRVNHNNNTGKSGVLWLEGQNKLRVRIKTKSKWVNIGYFDNLFDACAARLSAELKYFGEFSPVNRGCVRDAP